MMLDIAEFADIDLGPGTLYSAITRLVENGWIEPGRERGRQGPYHLTDQGFDRLQMQLERMQRVAKVGLRRLRTI